MHYAGYNGRRILPAAPADTLCKIQLTSFWIVPHLSLSGAPSLVLLFRGVARLLGLRGVPLRPHPSEGVG